MKVIDILNKRYNNEEVPKKIKYADDIYVLNNYTDEIERMYVWDENNDTGWLNREYLTLNTEVEVIEDKPEEEEIKELPPLEYIKMSSDNKTMSYGSEAVFYTLDSKFLGAIINRVIREVEDLKHRLEVTDKELEDYKKDLFSHNGSSIKLKTINDVDSSLKFGDTIMVKNDNGIGFIYDNKGVTLSKDKI